jgi:enediyne biosynthesis thioesterase
VRAYEYRHVVGLEETNIVGNVYYANHVRWQGRCREMFLRDHASETIEQLSQGLYLVTTRVSCEYFDELRAFDEIVIRMYAHEILPGRVTMSFDYVRRSTQGEQLVARGQQQVASMQKDGERVRPVAMPPGLLRALQEFREA